MRQLTLMDFENCVAVLTWDEDGTPSHRWCKHRSEVLDEIAEFVNDAKGIKQLRDYQLISMVDAVLNNMASVLWARYGLDVEHEVHLDTEAWERDYMEWLKFPVGRYPKRPSEQRKEQEGEQKKIIAYGDHEAIARCFHDNYEKLAPDFGYTTNPETSVKWEAVNEKNKGLMIATVAAVMKELIGE